MKCPFCEGDISVAAAKCKHCGEWLNKETSSTGGGERETCQTCGKKMIPRIIMGPPMVFTVPWTPVPKSSVCPFCGSTHKVFQPSPAEKVWFNAGLVALRVIFGGLFVFLTYTLFFR